VTDDNNPYELRAELEVEQRRIRTKADSPESLRATVFAIFGERSDPQALVDDEPERPHREHRELTHEASWRRFVGGDTPVAGIADDEVVERSSGAHRGELCLWFGDGYDVGVKPQWEVVTWSKGDAHGKHYVQIDDRWREGRIPDPPEWCSLFAAERTAGFIGCDEPLPLDWPEPQCEFPYFPRMWWRDDRPAYCHCVR